MLSAHYRIERSSQKEERSDRVQRNRPQRGVSAERRVRRGPPAGRRSQQPQVERSQRNRHDRGQRHSYQGSRESVTRPTRQEKPGGACAEVGDREDSAGCVVRLEEARCPVDPLRDRLAESRCREETKTRGPERLLPRRPTEEASSQKSAEENRHERSGKRKQRVGHSRYPCRAPRGNRSY